MGQAACGTAVRRQQLLDARIEAISRRRSTMAPAATQFWYYDIPGARNEAAKPVENRLDGARDGAITNVKGTGEKAGRART